MSKHRLKANTPQYSPETGGFEHNPSRTKKVLTAIGEVAAHAPLPLALTSAIFMGSGHPEPHSPPPTIEGKISPAPPEAASPALSPALTPVDMAPRDTEDLPDLFKFEPPKH